MWASHEQVLRYLNMAHGFDFCLNRYSSLERKINERMDKVKAPSGRAYIRYLENDPAELTKLVDLLTVNVSRFFRNPLLYEILASRIWPLILMEKEDQHNPVLRIWSAGCAMGEEPYSVAIMLKELLEDDLDLFNIQIFGTDINSTLLKKAETAKFNFDQVREVRFGLYQKYFKRLENDFFQLNPEIKQMVRFSIYDITDPKTHAPPDSVFGDFDLVLCRNLLIYFEQDQQLVIFNKLFRALSPTGFLVLGDAERLPAEFEPYFTIEDKYSRLYRKTGIKNLPK